MSERKFGWTEKGILGFIFAPMGALFTALGLVLYGVGAGTDPEDPLIFLCVFGGMGSVSLLTGLILLWTDVHRRGVMRRALENGDYVMARIVGVQHRVNVNTGGTYPCVVECHYHNPDTGEIHVYFSRYLYFDPSDMFTAREVPVYIDRMNEKHAFVDIDAVLPKVVMHRA